MFRRKKPESNAPPGIGGGSRVKQTRAEKQAEAAQKAAQPKKRGEVPELMAVCAFLARINPVAAEQSRCAEGCDEAARGDAQGDQLLDYGS